MEEGICAKMEQLLQFTFTCLPEGNLSLLIFSSPSPYAIVIDLCFTRSPTNKRLQRFAREREPFCSLCSHITIPLCVSLHKIN